jgi:uncharacterized membrane protein YcaP (DUF421 family)
MDAMEELLGLHQHSLEWYQMVSRTVIVFVFALFFLRLTGMRSFGTGSAFDMVLNITIGAILSRSITGEVPFIPSLIASAALVLCHQLISFWSFHSRTARKVTEGESMVLYKDGTHNEKNQKKGRVTMSDMVHALRNANIDDFEKAKSLHLEINGKISVVKKKE